MQDNSLTDAVRAGADALDIVRPGWRDEIDPERLDMGSAQDDVLGQLFGDFDSGVAQLKSRLKTDHDVSSSDYLMMRGFAVEAAPGSDKECALLTNAWRETIVKDRLAA